MPYTIYPERREVSDETVIAWAKDSLCNQALKALDTGDGDANEAMGRDVCEATMRNHEDMTLAEAMAILEDEGSVTFGNARTFTGFGSDGFDINALPESVEVVSDDDPEQEYCPEHGLVTVEHDEGTERCPECQRATSATAEEAERFEHQDDEADDEPFTDHPEVPPCPACSNGFGVLLGQLGNLVHFRCRACGMDFNVKDTGE